MTYAVEVRDGCSGVSLVVVAFGFDVTARVRDGRRCSGGSDDRGWIRRFLLIQQDFISAKRNFKNN